MPYNGAAIARLGASQIARECVAIVKGGCFNADRTDPIKCLDSTVEKVERGDLFIKTHHVDASALANLVSSSDATAEQRQSGLTSSQLSNTAPNRLGDVACSVISCNSASAQSDSAHKAVSSVSSCDDTVAPCKRGQWSVNGQDCSVSLWGLRTQGVV